MRLQPAKVCSKATGRQIHPLRAQARGSEDRKLDLAARNLTSFKT